jgi:hypothetical protein
VSVSLHDVVPSTGAPQRNGCDNVHPLSEERRRYVTREKGLIESI